MAIVCAACVQRAASSAFPAVAARVGLQQRLLGELAGLGRLLARVLQLGRRPCAMRDDLRRLVPQLAIAILRLVDRLLDLDLRILGVLGLLAEPRLDVVPQLAACRAPSRSIGLPLLATAAHAAPSPSTAATSADADARPSTRLRRAAAAAATTPRRARPEAAEDVAEDVAAHRLAVLRRRAAAAAREHRHRRDGRLREPGADVEPAVAAVLHRRRGRRRTGHRAAGAAGA